MSVNLILFSKFLLNELFLNGLSGIRTRSLRLSLLKQRPVGSSLSLARAALYRVEL